MSCSCFYQVGARFVIINSDVLTWTSDVLWSRIHDVSEDFKILHKNYLLGYNLFFTGNWQVQQMGLEANNSDKYRKRCVTLCVVFEL